MSWYKEGSVNITQGSNTVIGVGTKWTNPLIGVCAGQMLILKTANTIEIYEIASVQSDTQLTLANQYSRATKTGVSYEIPTAPNVSIEALALRISEMLNYYQQQMNGWQSILTGTGDITLAAPDGRVVTIKSQRALTEAINNTLIATKTVINGVLIYNVSGQVNFDSKPKIAGIEPIYIVESYANGNSWYNVYSNGFIEQTGVINAKTPTAGAICATTVNLLKPMKTQNYSVSIDKINNGLWGDVAYSQAARNLTDFLVASFSLASHGEALIRWTVRGY